LLLGARHLPLSIDVSYPHGAQQQTRRTPLQRSNSGTDDALVGKKEEEVAGYVSVEPVSLSTSAVERSESDAVLEVELMSCPVDARSKM